MDVPVGELQSTMAPRRTTAYRTYGDWASDTFLCHGQKRDNLSRASQRARGATKKWKIKMWKMDMVIPLSLLSENLK